MTIEWTCPCQRIESEHADGWRDGQENMKEKKECRRLGDDNDGRTLTYQAGVCVSVCVLTGVCGAISTEVKEVSPPV